MNPTLPDTPSQRPRGVRMLAVLASAALMAACGGGDKGASQTAARVNKDEVTVHQINFVFEVFDRANTPAMAVSEVRRLAAHRDGALYVGVAFGAENA